MIRLATVPLLLLLAQPVIADPLAVGELFDLDESTAEVNSGELVVITPPLDREPHHLLNRFTVTHQSLADGWVVMAQCHDNLDAIDRVEVDYAYRQMRKLRVTESRRIDRSRVENGTVQMEGVREGARLCVAAEVNLLKRVGDGYRLTSGPYHRRFLDGYYPMHLTVEIVYPAERLTVTAIDPNEQDGIKVRRDAGSLGLDIWFEGKLMVDISFGEKR